MRSTMLFACLLSVLIGYAQESGDETIPGLLVKTNLLTAVNPFKSLATLGADIRLSPRWAAEVGGGRYFGGSAFADDDGETYQGWHWNAGFRCYLVRQRASAAYIGADAQKGDVVNQRRYRLSRQGGAYNEIALLDRNVNTLTLAPKAGLLIYMGAKRRFVFDIYSGIGVRFSDVGVDLPADAAFLPNDQGLFEINVDINEGQDVRPIYQIGVHLAYRIF